MNVGKDACLYALFAMCFPNLLRAELHLVSFLPATSLCYIVVIEFGLWSIMPLPLSPFPERETEMLLIVLSLLIAQRCETRHEQSEARDEGQSYSSKGPRNEGYQDSEKECTEGKKAS